MVTWLEMWLRQNTTSFHELCSQQISHLRFHWVQFSELNDRLLSAEPKNLLTWQDTTLTPCHGHNAVSMMMMKWSANRENLLIAKFPLTLVLAPSNVNNFSCFDLRVDDYSVTNVLLINMFKQVYWLPARLYYCLLCGRSEGQGELGGRGSVNCSLSSSSSCVCSIKTDNKFTNAATTQSVHVQRWTYCVPDTDYKQSTGSQNHSHCIHNWSHMLPIKHTSYLLETSVIQCFFLLSPDETKLQLADVSSQPNYSPIKTMRRLAGVTNCTLLASFRHEVWDWQIDNCTSSASINELSKISYIRVWYFANV